MSYSSIALLVIVAECVVLLVFGIMGKLTRKEFAAIAVASAIAASVAFVRDGMAPNPPSTAGDAAEKLYVAAKLVLDDHPRDALGVLASTSETTELADDRAAVRALAYNLSGATRLSCMYLEDLEREGAQDLDQLYELSFEDEMAPSGLRSSICDEALAAAGGSPEEVALWDEVVATFLESNEGEDTRLASDDYRLAARDALAHDESEQAYKLVRDAAEGGDAYADVIVSQMYVQGFDERVYADSDIEFDALLANLTSKQVAATRARMRQRFGGSTDADSSEAAGAEDEYRAAAVEYELARASIDEAVVRRAIRYLQECEPVPEEARGHHALQLGYLYYLVNDFDQARAHLDQVFTALGSGEGDSLGEAAKTLVNASTAVRSRGYGNDFDIAYEELMSVLYGDVLPDVGDEGFEKFLNRYVDGLTQGLSIESVSTAAWPEVVVYVRSAYGDGALASSNLAVVDTGEAIEDFEVSDSGMGSADALSICYALDVSDSMAGKHLVDSKNALRESMAGMEEKTQVALTSFADTAQVNCELTRSSTVLSSRLSVLETSGGTNIAAGILKACEALRDGEGSPTIILVSDGFDMHPSEIDEALLQAKDMGATIYTIGIEGCNNEYLSYLARETGGLFVRAEDSSELSDILRNISEYVRNEYVVRYSVTDGDASQRYVSLRQLEGMASARKDYVLDDDSTGIDYAQIRQKSGYFRQTGGTMEVGQ